MGQLRSGAGIGLNSFLVERLIAEMDQGLEDVSKTMSSN